MAKMKVTKESTARDGPLTPKQQAVKLLRLGRPSGSKAIEKDKVIKFPFGLTHKQRRKTKLYREHKKAYAVMPNEIVFPKENLTKLAKQSIRREERRVYNGGRQKRDILARRAIIMGVEAREIYRNLPVMLATLGALDSKAPTDVKNEMYKKVGHSLDVIEEDIAKAEPKSTSMQLLAEVKKRGPR